MQVLVIGGGGREHALAWSLARSGNVDQVFVAPGNAGTAMEKSVSNIDIAVDDIDGLVAFARNREIALTVVGPEAPLVAGIVDRFRSAGLGCFGPTAAAAQLEGSKSFAKSFMSRHGIPTADHRTFTRVDEAISHVREASFPLVIKADGLAAGKGVIIVDDVAGAEKTIRDMLSENTFGQAGSRVVVEQFLHGEEASFICLVDGHHVLPMASSQDHKAAYDGDLGPNTGGMGAYSPSPQVDQAMSDRIMDQVIVPVVQGMAAEGIPYTGFLYAGLMIGDDGIPNVVEFNCRFGDPEAQPVLSRLKSDLAAHCLAAIRGELQGEVAQWDSRPCLGVVMAADGYPDRYTKGQVIRGLDQSVPETRVFHAGTADQDGAVVTAGGRVLCVTAMGDSVADAQHAAYQRVKQISWSGSWYRSDIGHRAVARKNH